MIYLNGTPLNVTLFPDNTSQVWKLNQDILETTNFAHITWDFDHEGEFMHLAQLKHLLDKYNFKTCLRVSYLPYARQDKPIRNDNTFALRTFASLLNGLGFDQIICIDVHSHLAKHLIYGLESRIPISMIALAQTATNSDLLCYPDAGAAERYSAFSTVPALCGLKVRDQSTGQITQYDLIGSAKDKNVLIIDDICDGGATFVLLAKALYDSGAKEVNLFVSHGIFSKGLSPLNQAGIKHIYTIKGEVSEVQAHLTYRSIK